MIIVFLIEISSTKASSLYWSVGVAFVFIFYQLLSGRHQLFQYCITFDIIGSSHLLSHLPVLTALSFVAILYYFD